MENKNILIVDDSIANLDILVEFLDMHTVVDATNGKDAIEIALEEDIDLILLDIMMPDMNGFEVCSVLKSQELTKHIPIIFITANSDEDSIEKAYDIGGIDYITKPFKPKELLARVKRELQLQDLQKELKLLASTDSMTKLFNRRYFTKISKTLLDLAKRNKTDSSIIMLDIDKFKKINDTYGHQTGDDVIIAFSKILQKSCRKSDIICRWGGEEFIIFLPQTNIDGALIIADKIRVVAENSVHKSLYNQEVKFTISAGISLIENNKDGNIEAPINRADEALYMAKESGRNRVCTKL